jgi:hypothetical protein
MRLPQPCLLGQVWNYNEWLNDCQRYGMKLFPNPVSVGGYGLHFRDGCLSFQFLFHLKLPVQALIMQSNV